MNRRAFLAALAAAAVAPAANAAIAGLAAPRRKVVIVGGGLAGLSCAYELQKYGLDVVVLEGQPRSRSGHHGTNSKRGNREWIFSGDSSGADLRAVQPLL